ncbi:MAG: hypothetical protein WDZ51_01950 [Pirellulaceae bacterium]
MMEVQHTDSMAIAIVPVLVVLLGLGLGLSLVVYLAISRKWVAAVAVFVGGGVFCLILLTVVAGLFYTRVSATRMEAVSEVRRANVEELRRIGEALHPREFHPPEASPDPEVPDRPMPVEPQEAADGDVGGPRGAGPLEPYARNLRQITQGVSTLLASASDDPELTLRRVIPEGRPEWVEREPYWEGKVQFRAVSSGPFDNPVDCKRALDEQTRRAVDDYIGEHLNHSSASNYVSLDNDFIRDHIHIGTYEEELDISFGEMRQSHAHLQFNDHTREEVERQWSLAQRTNRLIYLGAGFAAVLASLSIFYIGLGGESTKSHGPPGRLRAAVILAILLVGSGAVVLYNTIPLI